jgi:hypothetical protein
MFQQARADIFSNEPDVVRHAHVDPRRYETHFNVLNPNEVSPLEGDEERVGKKMMANNPNLTSSIPNLPEEVERFGKKQIAVNPNYTSHMENIGLAAEGDVERFGKKQVAVNPNYTSHMENIGVAGEAKVERSSKKMSVNNPNLTSRFEAIGISAPPADEDRDAFKPSKKIFNEQIVRSGLPQEEAFQPGLRQFHRGARSQILHGEKELQIREPRMPRGNESSFNLHDGSVPSPAGKQSAQGTPERASSR